MISRRLRPGLRAAGGVRRQSHGQSQLALRDDRWPAGHRQRSMRTAPPGSPAESIDRLLPVHASAMAVAVALSNYLVQFPVGWFGTWGTAVFPVCFLITDLANRHHGADAARKVVYTGFVVGVPASLLVGEPRIAFASGTAFLLSQLLDVGLFDKLRQRGAWWVAPLASSVTASAVDSALFGVVAFGGVPMGTELWPVRLPCVPHIMGSVATHRAHHRLVERSHCT